MLGKLFRKRSEIHKADEYTISIEVSTLNNILLCLGYGRLNKDNELEIKDRRGNNLPYVIYNTNVKVKGITKNKNTFIAKGKITGSSPKIWRIGELQLLADKENRQFIRQIINRNGQVIYIRLSNLDRYECKIVDISAGGALIALSKQYIKPDSKIEVIFKGLREELTLPCKVIRVETDIHGYRYGCQFEKMSNTLQSKVMQEVFEAERQNKIVSNTEE